MINEIKRRRDAGNRVFIECVDREAFLGFKSGIHREKNEKVPNDILEVAEIVVTGTDPYRGIITVKDCATNILFDELEFFKIKEPSFDDLVDKAIKAVRDYVAIITHLELDNITIESINYDLLSPIEIYRKDEFEKIQKAINWVDSLYTETFVIDDLESLRKVVVGANGVLTNGSNFKVWRGSGKYMGKDKLYIEFESETTNHASLEVLKGAVITQRKGVA